MREDHYKCALLQKEKWFLEADVNILNFYWNNDSLILQILGQKTFPFFKALSINFGEGAIMCPSPLTARLPQL